MKDKDLTMAMIAKAMELSEYVSKMDLGSDYAKDLAIKYLNRAIVLIETSKVMEK